MYELTTILEYILRQITWRIRCIWCVLDVLYFSNDHICHAVPRNYASIIDVTYCCLTLLHGAWRFPCYFPVSCARYWKVTRDMLVSTRDVLPSAGPPWRAMRLTRAESWCSLPGPPGPAHRRTSCLTHPPSCQMYPWKCIALVPSPTDGYILARRPS